LQAVGAEPPLVAEPDPKTGSLSVLGDDLVSPISIEITHKATTEPKESLLAAGVRLSGEHTGLSRGINEPDLLGFDRP